MTGCRSCGSWDWGFADRVPDARTIWLFREKLYESWSHQNTFRAFRRDVEGSGLHRHVGPDRRCEPDCRAAPAQHDDEKKAIKEGRIPEEWKEKPAKLRHKDRDARWTVKFTKG